MLAPDPSQAITGRRSLACGGHIVQGDHLQPPQCAGFLVRACQMPSQNMTLEGPKRLVQVSTVEEPAAHLDHEHRVRGHEAGVEDLPPGHAARQHGMHAARQPQQVLHLLQQASESHHIKSLRRLLLCVPDPPAGRINLQHNSPRNVRAAQPCLKEVAAAAPTQTAIQHTLCEEESSPQGGWRPRRQPRWRPRWRAQRP